MKITRNRISEDSWFTSININRKMVDLTLEGCIALYDNDYRESKILVNYNAEDYHLRIKKVQNRMIIKKSYMSFRYKCGAASLMECTHIWQNFRSPTRLDQGLIKTSNYKEDILHYYILL